MTGLRIFALILFLMGVAWVLWLVFKHNILSQGVGKLLSYFVGVVITLIAVMLILTWVVPWWADKMLTDTENSRHVQSVESTMREIWQEAVNSNQPAVVSTAVPIVTPQSTQQPVAQPTVGGPGTVSGQSVTVGERTHVVQSGETLYRLSKTYGVSVQAIQQRNNLQNENINVGQTLIIPAP
ncbi:MAG: LysM peptidoglycan-binding domain-containing protein [Anaerolineae bacterium]|nr:LysM peptidoglycan-binding domain-containing protein [Anaerolineae bacterium]